MSSQVVFGLNVYANYEYDVEICGSDRIHSFKGRLVREPNVLGILRLALYLFGYSGDIIGDLDCIIALMKDKVGT